MIFRSQIVMKFMKIIFLHKGILLREIPYLFVNFKNKKPNLTTLEVFFIKKNRSHIKKKTKYLLTSKTGGLLVDVNFNSLLILFVD